MEKVWRDQVYLTILQTDFNWIIFIAIAKLFNRILYFWWVFVLILTLNFGDFQSASPHKKGDSCLITP